MHQQSLEEVAASPLWAVNLRLEDFCQYFRDALNTSSISQKSGQTKKASYKRKADERGGGCVCKFSFSSKEKNLHLGSG